MSASAAAPTKVNITLKAVTFSDAVLNALSKTNASQRENLLRQALDMVGAETNEDASKLPEYAQKVNNMPQTLSGSGTEEDPYVVEKGNTFFVAVDLDLQTDKGTDGKYEYGLGSNSSIRVDYSGGAFTYEKVHNSYINNPGIAGYLGADTDILWDYYPGTTPYTFTATNTANIQTTSPGTGSILVNATNGTGYLPKNATWDCYLQLKAAKVGTHKIEVEKYDSTTQIENVANSSMSLGKMNYKSSRNTEANAPGASTNMTNSSVIVSEPIYVTVTNPSEAPDGNYEGAIINKKNLPYMSAAAAADENARTDYLKFPSDETKFKVGDTVMFYKTTENENEYGELIGETTITADNLVVLNADGTVTAAPSLNDGNAVNTTEGLALKLVDDLKGSTEANKPVSADYSFLKDEKEIYIARREKVADSEEAKDPSSAASSPKVAINPEENIFYYSKDTDVVPAGVPGSKDNPLKIKLGDTMEDVLDALDAENVILSTSVNAPVESGVRTQNTAQTYVNSWMQASLYNGTAGLTQKGMNTDGVYNKHGLFTIRNPYKEKEIDGVTYKQPTDYYKTPSAIPEGGYASVIYVNVLPNPADYYLAVNDEGTSLTVLGDTKDFMIESDQIFLWDDETKTGISWEALFTIDAADLTKTGITPETLKNTPAVGDIMWLSYQNTPVDGVTYTQSDKIQIRVADGDTAIVLQDTEVEETFGPKEKLNDLLNYVDPVKFVVVGPVEKGGEVKSDEFTLTAAQMKKWVGSANDAGEDTYDAVNSARLSVKKVAEDNTTTDSDLATLNGEKVLDDRYEVSFPIPGNEEGTAEYNALTGSTVRTYSNTDPGMRSVKITAKVSRSIRLYGANLKFEVTENKPLGTKDTVRITGDEAGQLAEALEADAGKVQLTLVSEDGTKTVGVAFGNLDGVKDITVEPVEGGYNYTVQFTQTAREYNTRLRLFTGITGGESKEQTMKDSEGNEVPFLVAKQEEYALFSVDQPTPETVQIVKSDLVADPETDTYTADDVINKIADVSGVTGPKLTYGYYMSDEENSGNTAPVQDPSATWSMAVVPVTGNIYAAANWTAGGTDFETAPVTITLNDGVVDWTALSAANKNTADTAETTLPINKPSATWTAPVITQKVEVVAKKYDEEETPKPSDIITNSSDTVANNNPYPQNDEIRVHNGPAADGYANLVVDIYTAYDAENDKLSGHIASAKLGTDDTTVSLPAVFDSGIAPATVLNSMGGKLWYTVRKEAAAGVPGMAPSDPIAKAYNVEDYILWTGTGLPSITPETLQMRYSETGAVDFENNIKTRLPNTAKAVAVHLTQDENGKYEIRNSEQVTVYPTVKQWLTAAGDPVTNATFSDPAPDATADYQLKAQYDAASVTTPGDDPDAPKNEINVPEGLSDDKTAKIISRIDAVGTTSPEVTPAAGYDITNEVTLTLTDDTTTVAKTVKPDPAAVKIDPSTDPDHPENYTINIDISGATNKDDFDITKMDVIVKYPGPDGNYHYFLLPTPFTAVEGEEGKITPAVINKDSATVTGDDLAAKIGNDPSLAGLTFESFQGLDPTVNGTVEIYFKEADKVKSDRQDATYEKASGALTIAKDTRIATLNVTAGMILNNQSLLDLVKSYTSATATLSNNTESLPIALKTSGTGANVDWTLKKVTFVNEGTETESVNWTGTGDWTGTVADNYSEALANVPDGNNGFALVADFDETALTEQNITNADPEKKVAFVKIKLYTNYDPDNPDNANPLQLTEGNSDVWKSLKADSTADDAAKAAAQQYLDSVNASLGEGAEARTVNSYRDELVFYYKTEGYYQTNSTNPDYVAKYVDASVDSEGNAQEADYSGMIATVDGTAIADWLAANPDAEIKVQEVVIGDDGYGSSRAQLYTVGEGEDAKAHIQPNTGAEASNYYDNTKATSSTVRGEEYYRIIYTIKVDGELYTAYRDVKLRYETGDVDLDDNINTGDAALIVDKANNVTLPFVDESGVEILTLVLQLMDVDMDGNANTGDAALIVDKANDLYTIPPMRF